jgi:hypothetical protein
VSLRLIGDEMMRWSDLDGNHGPGPVRGSALTPLVAAAHGRTLIAGPHDPALIDTAPPGDLTVLVRGRPDADALAARYADRHDVTVCCGGLDKLDVAPFDTVIALDGLDRLRSAEGPQPTWEQTLRLLVAALRPGGRLVLTVENPLGMHTFLSLPTEPDDGGWAATGEYDPTHPAGSARVTNHLRAAGLRAARTYAVYPAPISPTALLGADLLADDEVSGFLGAALRRACAPTGSFLADPGRLAGGAVRHGVADALAPGWIVVADRAPAATRAALPEAVVVEGPAHYQVDRDPGGGWARRAGGAGPADAVPPGHTLEYHLIGACLRRDLPAMRTLLTAWQSDGAAGVPAEQVIVGPDGAFTALGPGGKPSGALRQLADRLINGGFADWWTAPGDADDLARGLAAMAGQVLDAAVPAGTDSGPDQRVDVGELVRTRDRLARELAEARAKARWYEEALTARDDSLKQARRTIELLSGAGPARFGMAFLGGVRTARRHLRVVVRHARPRR